MKFIKKLLTNILIAIAIVLPVVLYTAGLSYIASIVPEVYFILIIIGGGILGMTLVISIVEFLDDIKYK